LFAAWVRDMKGNDANRRHSAPDQLSPGKSPSKKARTLNRDLVLSLVPKKQQNTEKNIIASLGRITNCHMEEKNIHHISTGQEV
jgi:hypothetical protein